MLNLAPIASLLIRDRMEPGLGAARADRKRTRRK